MNWLCRTFGHKLTIHIYDCNSNSEKIRVTRLLEPMCLRCCLSIDEIKELSAFQSSKEVKNGIR